jgi:hypothetical protein
MKGYQDMSLEVSKIIHKYCAKQKRLGYLKNRGDVMDLLDGLKVDLYEYTAYDLFKKEW